MDYGITWSEFRPVASSQLEKKLRMRSSFSVKHTALHLAKKGHNVSLTDTWPVIGTLRETDMH